jgi:hypothetical protein
LVKELELDLEGALKFLATIDEQDTSELSIKFVDDLANVVIDIEGKNYHSSVPSELARGMWEFQEEIYRAVTYALYGVEDIRKLRPEERATFQLVFEVSEGSTLLTALLEKFTEKLAEGLTKMDSKDKVKTIVAVAIVLTTGWVAISISDGAKEVEKAQIAKEAELGKESAKTDQLNVLKQVAQTSAVSARFAQATEEGAKSIIKGASDADSIRLGRVKFDRSAIVDANQRASKEKAIPLILTEEFMIISGEKRGAEYTKFVIANATHPEFRIVLADEEFEQEAKDKLWTAFRQHKPVKLEVNVTLMRDQIKTAQLVRIH